MHVWVAGCEYCLHGNSTIPHFPACWDMHFFNTYTKQGNYMGETLSQNTQKCCSPIHAYLKVLSH